MVDITTKIEINPDDLIKMLKDTDEKSLIAGLPIFVYGFVTLPWKSLIIPM
jgi:hypothetical protein